MEVWEKILEMTSFTEIIEDPGSLLMLAIAGFLLFLGIRKRYEPLLLIPIGFGIMLANIPGGNMYHYYSFKN